MGKSTVKALWFDESQFDRDELDGMRDCDLMQLAKSALGANVTRIWNDLASFQRDYNDGSVELLDGYVYFVEQ